MTPTTSRIAKAVFFSMNILRYQSQPESYRGFMLPHSNRGNRLRDNGMGWNAIGRENSRPNGENWANKWLPEC
jgi:hypothetical protein